MQSINYRGNTPLHEAAKVNNYEIVKLLISYNANPLLVNKNGLRPIQLTNESNIIKVLSESMDEQKYQAERRQTSNTTSKFNFTCRFLPNLHIVVELCVVHFF